MNDLIIPLILIIIVALLIYQLHFSNNNWSADEEINEAKKANMINQTDLEQNVDIDYYALYIKEGIENTRLLDKCAELALELAELKATGIRYIQSNQKLIHKQIQVHGDGKTLTLPVNEEYAIEVKETFEVYTELCVALGVTKG